MSNRNPKHVGLEVRKARKSAGITQQEVAAHMGFSRATIVSLEQGIRAFRDDELVKLGALFDVPVGQLVRRSSLCSVLRDAVVAGTIDAPDVGEMVDDGDLSEGQACRILRVDRIEFRRLKQGAIS